MKPLLLFLLFTFAAAAQAAPGWIADPKNGCRVWSTQKDLGDRVEWKGACVGGKAHGSGTLRWFFNGRNYETDEGEFRAGRLTGHAVVTFDDGARFEGQFLNEKPNGEGTWRTAAGETYTGKWKMGCFSEGGRQVNVATSKEACAVKKK